MLCYGPEYYRRKQDVLAAADRLVYGESGPGNPMPVKPEDIVFTAGAISLEALPMSCADIYPDETDYQTDEIISALNQKPVLMIHLARTSSHTLRQDVVAASRMIGTKTVVRKHNPYVVAVSYNELIRAAVRGMGMHPATVQTITEKSFVAARTHWRHFMLGRLAGKPKPTDRQAEIIKTYQFDLSAAFMKTADFVKLGGVKSSK